MLSALSGASGLIINSTISGNVAVGPGGGIAPVAIGNSIIAGNLKRPATLAMNCALTPTFSGRPATEVFLAPDQDMYSLLGRIGKQAGGLSCAGRLPYLSRCYPVTHDMRDTDLALIS